VPFVQGQIRNESLTVTIETQCAHCAQPIHLTIDSELNYRVHETGAAPLVFEPQVNWATLNAPNIIDAY
jgi:hypothetical protein